MKISNRCTERNLKAAQLSVQTNQHLLSFIGFGSPVQSVWCFIVYSSTYRLSERMTTTSARRHGPTVHETLRSSEIGSMLEKLEQPASTCAVIMLEKIYNLRRFSV